MLAEVSSTRSTLVVGAVKKADERHLMSKRHGRSLVLYLLEADIVKSGLVEESIDG
jgi:hypothetical protein